MIAGSPDSTIKFPHNNGDNYIIKSKEQIHPKVTESNMNEFIKKNMEKLTKCIKPHKIFRTSSGVPCVVNNEHTLEQMLTHDYREEDSTQGYSKYSKNHNSIKEEEQSSSSINSGFRAKTSMKERKRENEVSHGKETETKERRPNSSRKKL